MAASVVFPLIVWTATIPEIADSESDEVVCDALTIPQSASMLTCSPSNNSRRDSRFENRESSSTHVPEDEDTRASLVVVLRALSLVAELEVATVDVKEAGVGVVGGQSWYTVSLACQIVVTLDDTLVVVLNKVDGVTSKVDKEGMTVHRTQLSGNPAGTETCRLSISTSSGAT